MKPSVAIAGAFLILVALGALLAPYVAGKDAGAVIPYDPTSVDLTTRFATPGGAHPLGTDELGRDLASRMIHGSRIPLEIGLICGLMSFAIGSGLGAIAGFAGGVVDWCILRLTETVLCFPFLFVALAAAGFFDPSTAVIIGTVVLVSWPAEARIVRGEVLRLRRSELAASAVAAGATPARVLLRHLVPNAVPPAIVSAAFGAAAAIGAEAALSFLGLGVQPPEASWGTILAGAEPYLKEAWWIGLWPALAILATILAIHVLAEEAGEWGDPRRGVRS